jgi:hypothetical protein
VKALVVYGEDKGANRGADRRDDLALNTSPILKLFR